MQVEELPRRIYKDSYQTNKKKKSNLIENCADSNRPFTEEETDTADKHETLSTSLLGKCKSKPHRGIIIRLSIKMAKSGNIEFEGNMNRCDHIAGRNVNLI